SFQKPQAKPKWMPLKTSATRPRMAGDWPRARYQLAPPSTSRYRRILVNQSHPRYGAARLSKPASGSHNAQAGGTSAGSVSDFGDLNANRARPIPYRDSW